MPAAADGVVQAYVLLRTGRPCSRSAGPVRSRLWCTRDTVLRAAAAGLPATRNPVRRITILASVLLAAACAALGIDPELDVAPPPPRIAADTQVRLANGTWVSPEGTRVRFTLVVPRMQPDDLIPLVLSLHGLASAGDSVPPYYGQGLLETLTGPALRPLGALIV